MHFFEGSIATVMDEEIEDQTGFENLSEDTELGGSAG